jgi:hypothetical protein
MTDVAGTKSVTLRTGCNYVGQADLGRPGAVPTEVDRKHRSVRQWSLRSVRANNQESP